MILHTPWTRELGLARCSVDLADEFRALGHDVDKFDLADAFPRRTRLGELFEGALFARRAVAFVRRHGHAYDVIQAEQGNLPVSRRRLRYDNVLVCRSDGLVHFYVEWLRERKRSGGGRAVRRGHVLGSGLRWAARRLHGGLAAVDRSFEAADLIVVLNRDELRFVIDQLKHGDKAVFLPNGLSEKRFKALAADARPPEERLREQHVVFVGHLSVRKGLEDLPVLVREVRKRIPAAHFSFLGAAMPAESVIGLFAETDRPHIWVTERFAPERLPRLLAGATVGVLPSYLEGFPLGVLEQLAAGIPTIAYDVPGSRELLGRLAPEALTSAGDVPALAAQVVRTLSLSGADYTALAARSRAVADGFRWRDIARETLAAYETARGRRRTRSVDSPQ